MTDFIVSHLRYPHNRDMRSPVHDLYWFQYFLLDVIGAIIVILVTIIFILIECLKICYKQCKLSKTKKD